MRPQDTDEEEPYGYDQEADDDAYDDYYPSRLPNSAIRWQGLTSKQPQHVVMGVIKAVVFAAVLALISCYKGMNCREGAEGVGRATTEAVVYSSITILISNFFLTLFLTRLLGA